MTSSGGVCVIRGGASETVGNQRGVFFFKLVQQKKEREGPRGQKTETETLLNKDTRRQTSRVTEKGGEDEGGEDKGGDFLPTNRF